MNKILFAFLLVFFTNHYSAYTQSGTADSLLRAIATHREEDSLKYSLYCQLASAYSIYDPEKGLGAADSVIAIGQRLNDSTALFFGYLNKGVCYYQSDKNTLALEMYDIAQSVTNDIVRISSVLENMGMVYERQGNYKAAIDVYLKVMKIYDDNSTILTDSNRKSGLFMSIGIVYRKLSRLDDALGYYNQALTAMEKNKDSASMGYILGNIGNVYSDKNEKEKAKEYYLKALAINKRIGNRKLIGSNIFNLGSLYREMSDYTNAFKYLDTALAIHRTLGLTYRSGAILSELGRAYAYAPPDVLAQRNIAYKLRFKKAIELTKQGIEITAAENYPEYERDAWQYLSEYYEEDGQYKNACYAYRQYSRLNDSIAGTEKKSDILRQEIEYEYDKQQAALKAEHEKQQALAAAQIKYQRTLRNYSLTGTGLILCIGGIGFASYRKKQKAIQARKEAEYQTEVANTEMKVLRAQMNPHFIFNSLNSIGAYISLNKTEPAKIYLSKFAKLMRLILENSIHKEVAVADDIKALEWYIQLEQLRMNKRFDYSIEIAKNVNQEETLIPPLLLQPFVENSILHGFADIETTGGLLHIGISAEEEMLICRIRDNGKGLSANKNNETNTAKRSLGTGITQSRINLLNHDAKINQAKIDISDEKEGVLVTVTLPLIRRF